MRGWGAQKETYQSANEPKQAWTKAGWAQMNPNKHKQNQMSMNDHEQKPNKNGDQQMNGDEQQRAWGQPSGDKWGPANDWRWAALRMMIRMPWHHAYIFAILLQFYLIFIWFLWLDIIYFHRYLIFVRFCPLLVVDDTATSPLDRLMYHNQSKHVLTHNMMIGSTCIQQLVFRYSTTPI